MKFIVHKQIPSDYEANTFYLLKGIIHRGRLDDSWNDYGYRTRYTLQYSDIATVVHEIGCTLIGEVGMGEHQASPNLPSEFARLNSRLFSIGAEEKYYNNLMRLENEYDYNVLMALNDFTLCRDLFDSVKNESVTMLSLLRNVNISKYEEHINKYYSLLTPPINLQTMRRIFGSTGWEDVDKALIEMQRLLFQANISLYYNAIATIGREVILRVANEIYEDELHRDKALYPNAPKKDQSINKLHGFVDYACEEGDISENIKKQIKATIELVNGYIHKEQAEPFECFLCVNAVISLVFQLSIIYKRERCNEIAL